MSPSSNASHGLAPSLVAVLLAALVLLGGCAAMEQAAQTIAGEPASDPYDRSGSNRRATRPAPAVPASRPAPPAPPVPPAQPSAPRAAEPAPAPLAEAPARAPVAPADLSAIEFGDYFALVIGNNAYRHLPSLETPHSDADAVAGMLRDDYGFTVSVLKDATRTDVMSELSRYRRTLAATDNLLIYYAGHGWNDRDADEAYWLPVDAHEDDQTAWISNSTITQMIKAMQAKHVMVIADSCYSGTLTRGIALRQRAPGYLERLAYRRARTALTSGGNEPVADDGGAGHSVFSRALLDALRENRSVLDATGLYTAIRRPVMLKARQTPQYGDIRLAGHEDGDFLFVRLPQN